MSSHSLSLIERIKHWIEAFLWYADRYFIIVKISPEAFATGFGTGLTVAWIIVLLVWLF